ncbi:Pentatricopeptide repeat-containing protein -mitochondrial [Striga hermonthica]|uniref:Pentatricopeptide repeat-containing protein -mitochondrial n=1 Tax=Striga hermonthica TaxID=68872 RepID=A0A9N7RH26_STRHE|nr:Pentatricopeptide repeat-containing protein -mitochondrial [Striga hermonthica]
MARGSLRRLLPSKSRSAPPARPFCTSPPPDSPVRSKLLEDLRQIRSAVKLGDVGRGLELMSLMKNSGWRPSWFVYNVLISGLCKERRLGDARKLFDEMRRLNVAPTTVTYNTLIDGYCKSWDLEGAFVFRERMKNDKVDTNIVTYNTLLSGLCKMGRMDEANKVWGKWRPMGSFPMYSVTVLFWTDTLGEVMSKPQ